MIKYLFNFGFYKFGVEATLVMIVILISARLDIIAILYTGWLCLIFSASRETKARIWPIFQWFIVVVLLLQYILAVNLPPFLCYSKHTHEYNSVKTFKYDFDFNLLQNIRGIKINLSN